MLINTQDRVTAYYVFPLITECSLIRDTPLSTNDVEDVAVRVLEPSDFHVAADVDIALSRHVRHVIVLERNTLGFKRPHDLFHILTDYPRHGRGLVGSCIL